MRDRAWTVAALVVLAGAAVHLWYYRGYLLDDAFILFRYASNAARGWGLVFNHGERVEGYTSFLWVVWLWLWRSTGLEPTVVAVWTGRLAAVAVLVAVAGQTRGAPVIAAVAGPVYLALNRSFAASASNGMETCLFTLLVFLSLQGSGAWSWWLAGVASLVRPEGLIVVALLLLKDRRRAAAVLSLTPVLLHWVWRVWYYGDWLPNTFWAKVPWVYPISGVRYLGMFASEYRLGLLAPILLVGALAARRHLQLLFVMAFAAYVCLIGGDLMEFRFMVPILPALALFLSDGCRLLSGRAGGRAAGRWMSIGCVVLVALLQLPSLAGFTPREGMPSLEQLARSTRRWSAVGQWLGHYAREGEVVATTAAGAIPYYSDLPTIDMHGLSDRSIAQLPVDARGRVGHERVVSREYLCRRGVTFLLDHPDLRRQPSADPDTVSVRVRRRWLQFTTCQSVDLLRSVLSRRGADVWSPRGSVSPAHRSTEEYR
jgi:arabinofuranosyltransferase